jgi:hypothetical protein
LRFVDLPLGVALRQLAGTLHFSLYRWNKPKEPEYYIWQDLKMRNYEEAIRSSQREQREKEIRTFRQKAMDEAQKALDMKPEEALKLKESNPWLAYIGGTETGRAYAQLLLGLPPEAKELMLRGLIVSLPLADLAPELEKAAKQLMQGSWIAYWVGDDITHMDPPTHLVFTPETGSSDSGMRGNLIVGTYERKEGTTWVGSPGDDLGDLCKCGEMILNNANSPDAHEEGEKMFRLEAGETWDQIMAEDSKKTPLAKLAKLEQIQSKMAPNEQDLLVTVRPEKPDEINKDADILTRILDQITLQTKLSIVMEYHDIFDRPNEPFKGIRPTDTQPLYKILALLEVVGFEWEYHEHVISLRPKDWAIQRSYDISESFLATYRDKLKKEGFFDLDTIANIASSLTDGQIDHRYVKDLTLMPTYFDLESRSPLRFYGSLSTKQKTLLKSSAGLPFEALNDQQWQLLTTMIGFQVGEKDIQSGMVRLPAPREIWPRDDKGKELRGKIPDALLYNLVMEITGDEQSQPITIKREMSVQSKQSLDEFHAAHVETLEQWKKERNQVSDGQKDKN